MAVLNGTALVILVNGTAVGHAQNHSITMNNALRNITTKASAGFEESLDGLVSWSLSGDGLFAFSDANNTVDLTVFLLAGTEVTVRFTTSATTEEYWTGSAFVESIDMTSPTEDNVSYSFSLKGTSALTNPTFT